MNSKKLFLLDAMALIYRAYYALNKNPRINSKGVNTSAILGFANTLLDVIKNEAPTHIGVAFDTYAPTVRHEEFDFYKAHRQETPEDIVTSIPLIQRLIAAMNIPILALDGYEADDVIGTLAKQAEIHGFTTFMMTSDKDFGQLVTEHTLMYKPAKFGNKAEIMGVKEVCEKFGIERPEQVKDILGLWGDASDNIPGIPGFGEVTAKKLIAEYGSVENLVASAATISNPRWREKVEEFGDQALMSKGLATIILDVPIAFEEENLKMGPPDIEGLKELFNELEFRTFGQRYFTWLSTQSAVGSEGRGTKDEEKAQGTGHRAQGIGLHNKFPEGSKSPLGDLGVKSASSIQHPASSLFSETDFAPFATIDTTPHDYRLADTPETQSELLSLLQKQASFCFDTETTGLDPNDSELVGVSFSWHPHEAWYMPVPANYHEAQQLLSGFKPIFEDTAIGKTGQNLKFDIAILKWYDIEVRGPLFDTMLAHYLLQPDMRHNMNFLAESYLNYSPVPIESLIGKKGSSQLSMRMVDTGTVKEYAAEDADITWQLKEVFEPMLTETGTRKLFDEIEVPLIPVLASMEAEGVKIDSKALENYSLELTHEIQKVEQEIYSDAGVEFNISSPKQLGEVLFDRLVIVEKPKKTKTKQYSTGEDILSKLVSKHPIISKILDYRSLTKLTSTYVDVLPTLVNPRDGRIHTSYNQAVAATGRLSSNNPNLQNIPIRTERGREIRKAFVPRNENYTLLSADYSQIELRIIAHLSQDPAMMEDFRAGKDIHTATAAKIYSLPIDQVTREMRGKAKAVNFGIAYGMSAFGLSERLNIPRQEASDIIHQYFAEYPGIRRYMDETIEFAREHGYVETMMHRRRYLRDINSGNGNVRGFAERNAINAPIQGTAADMIKIAMISIFNEFEKRTLKSKMIMQVHDELVFDTLLEEAAVVKEILLDKMPAAIPLDIPVVIDMSTGNNWLEAH
ncbi:MAG: DNA polymerase I [Bacteroidales bacterium]|nr:DNA polymerase I [Bacteroidales bacterium]